MDGFLAFVVILAGVVWLFRYLRRRELERFRESDMKPLHELTGKMPDPAPVPSPVASPLSNAASASVTAVAAPAGASLRPAALDEIHAHVLRMLEALLGDRYRIFVGKPLADFIRLEKGPGELFGRSVSFVACDPADFSVVFALALRGAGQGEQAKYQYLERLMAEVGVPLASLPMMPNLSKAELEEQLAALSPSPLRQPAS